MLPSAATSHAPSMASPPPVPQTIQSPPITVVLTVVLLIFFLLGFFSIYFCRCILEALFHIWHLRRTPSGHLTAGGGGGGGGVNPSHNGLDPALIKSLPTFLYSTVKEVRKEKYALECAICLVEFTDDSFLRLLTVCYHVFHQECIDLWLESHNTCPVCRRRLDHPHLLAAKSPDPTSGGRDHPLSPVDAAVRIDIEPDGGDSILEAVRRRLEEQRRRERSARRECSSDVKRALARRDAERFTRSHSTGHSIVRLRDDAGDGEEQEEDPYTLRLPEHVRLRILRARHWTASCEAFRFERCFAQHRFCQLNSNDATPVINNNNNNNSGVLNAD